MKNNTHKLFSPGKILVILILCLWFASSVHAREIKIALDSPPNLEKSGSYMWAHTFYNHLKAKGLEVKEYPRGALGNEAEKLDQVSQGLLEVSMSDLGKIGQLNKFIFGMNAPYLFESIDHLDRALANTDIMERINSVTTPKGVRLLAIVVVGQPGGLFTTKKAVRSIDDMKGLRFRALDKNQVNLFKSLGAGAVIVPWGEVPNALQTGIADGYINPPFVPLMFGHTAFIKHFTDVGAMLPLRVAMASEDWYQGLSAKHRGIVDAGIQKATAADRKLMRNSRSVVFGELAKAGVEVIKLSEAERKIFEKLSKPTWTAILAKEDIQVFIDAAKDNR